MKAINIQHMPDGKVRFAFDHDMPGTYLEFNSPMDALLARVMKELAITRVSKTAFYADVGIKGETVSRSRHGKCTVPENYLYRLHIYSGIPIKELADIAKIEAGLFRHARALKVSV